MVKEYQNTDLAKVNLAGPERSMQILLRIYGMLIPLSALNLTGFGVQTTFLEVEYASQNVDQIKKAEGIFQKPFHRCSKDVQCEFVVKNVQTNDHQVYSREVQIPSYKGNLRIWKKHKFFATATQGQYTQMFIRNSMCLLLSNSSCQRI